MGAEVKWFGNGDAAVVVGEGAPRQSDNGDGTTTEVSTTTVVVFAGQDVIDVESDQLLDTRPASDPNTGLSIPGSPAQVQEAHAAANAPSDPTPAEVQREEDLTDDDLAAEIARLQAEQQAREQTKTVA